MSYELHEPRFDGTSADRWEEPDWEDIAGNDPTTIAGHFLLCADGFPPESVSDLELAVVDEDMRLNRNALADALHGPHSVETLDVREELADAVEDLVHELLRDNFESMPETKAGVDDQLLAWQEHEAEHEHEVEQQARTDDARYHEVKGEVIESGEERPEKGW